MSQNEYSIILWILTKYVREYWEKDPYAGFEPVEENVVRYIEQKLNPDGEMYDSWVDECDPVIVAFEKFLAELERKDKSEKVCDQNSPINTALRNYELAREDENASK